MEQTFSKNDYEALCDEIWRHNRLYFQHGAPVISDDEFDALTRLLEKVEKEHPEWVSPTSPSKRVGEAPLENFPEVVHRKPMLSLEKAFQIEELQAFYIRLEKLVDRKNPVLFAQPKMDGLAVTVVYENGHFVQAVTRGDGTIGSDISLNCKTIPQLPLRIAPKFQKLEVRGEVFMPKERFQEINKERAKLHLPLFANPRNAAAGSLKLLDSRELSKRSGLEIVFYGVSEQDPHKILFQSEAEKVLSDLGLPTFSNMSGLPIAVTKTVGSIEEMMSLQEEIHNARPQLPFQIDGVVFKLDSLDETESILPTNKHPRTAIAWKFGAEQAWTTLEAITVQVGRTGVITPVAELSSVELDGSTVKRATLHNLDEIRRKDIRPKDRVLIEKGGDVIPKVVMADTTNPNRESPWVFPEICPSCGTSLVHDTEEVYVRCPNRSGCPEQRIKEIIHFAGKGGLDIEHVGEKLVRQLYNKGLIQRASDLFHLTRDDLLSLEGIKEKSATNILTSIQKAKEPELQDFIMALGIRHVGIGAARDLARHAQRVENLLKVTRDGLLSIEGFGEKTADSVISALHESEIHSEIMSLLQEGVQPKSVESEKIEGVSEDHPLYGKSIVITGTLQHMTRSDAIRELGKRGALHTDTVSKKTSYVVVGESPGSKQEKARKLGIPILHEAEFLHLLSL